ncbi:HIRAN domain-containing protein [Cyanobium sp. Cruz-8H5]|nr:HIRAN domain-containing protein [Cyanobium sp. Cruz-8H5]
MTALFVAWQQPESRRYYPVGRLVWVADEPGLGADHRELFEFSYIRGAHEAAGVGFQPFLAFSDLQQVYRSHELFPFFANRLMSRNRADYRAHVERLGLEPDATAMQILARSGGARATDSIELFPLPTREPGRTWFLTHFWLHGYRHMSPEAQVRVLSLQPGEQLLTLREPSNPHDPHAIALLTTPDRARIGYFPRYLASDAIRLLEDCSSFEVFVERVNPDPAPLQQRLLCRLESCWPENFRPCSQDIYRPVNPDRVSIDPCQTASVH